MVVTAKCRRVLDHADAGPVCIVPAPCRPTWESVLSSDGSRASIGFVQVLVLQRGDYLGTMSDTTATTDANSTTVDPSEDKRLFLLDAFALIYRAYFSFTTLPACNTSPRTLKGVNSQR